MPTAITSQDELARLAGVTRLTVHRALRGGKGVGHATRQRILRLADENGYRPHAGAVAMRTGRTNCIGLLSGDPTTHSGVTIETLDSIHAQLDAWGMRLAIGSLPDQALATGEAMPNLIREWSADGLLITYTPELPEGMMGMVHRCRIPYVWINRHHDQNCVYPDDAGGARDGTRRLLELGHRRILYVSAATDSEHYSVAEREQGYREAMEEAGLSPRMISRDALGDLEAAPATAKAMLTGDARPTAVLAYGARGIMAFHLAATAMGWSVPNDLSLMTFSPKIFDEIGVRFSFMIVPFRDMGEAATQMLRRRIESPGESLPGRALPFRFHEGKTVGTVPA